MQARSTSSTSSSSGPAAAQPRGGMATGTERAGTEPGGHGAGAGARSRRRRGERARRGKSEAAPEELPLTQRRPPGALPSQARPQRRQPHGPSPAPRAGGCRRAAILCGGGGDSSVGALSGVVCLRLALRSLLAVLKRLRTGHICKMEHAEC